MDQLESLKEVTVRYHLTGESLVEWAKGQLAQMSQDNSQDNKDEDFFNLLGKLASIPEDDERSAVTAVTEFLMKKSPSFTPGSPEWIRYAQPVIVEECKAFLDGKHPIDRLCKSVISAEDFSPMTRWLGPLSEACGTFIFAYYHMGTVLMEMEEIEEAVREAAKQFIERYKSYKK